MGCSHLPHLFYTTTTSSRASRINRFFACFLTSRRYSKPSKESNGHGMERAPTTAEEFERVAEEFERIAEEKAHQGVASQTSEKAYDGSEEAALKNSRAKSAKEKYKEPVGKGNFHETGDE